MDAQTPFMFKGGEGVNAGVGEVEWVVAKERSAFWYPGKEIVKKLKTYQQCRLLHSIWLFSNNFFDADDGKQKTIYVLRYKYDSMFDSLNPIDGKVTGASAKGEPGYNP